jgi:hypothetical protein
LKIDKNTEDHKMPRDRQEGRRQKMTTYTGAKMTSRREL